MAAGRPNVGALARLPLRLVRAIGRLLHRLFRMAALAAALTVIVIALDALLLKNVRGRSDPPE